MRKSLTVFAAWGVRSPRKALLRQWIAIAVVFVTGSVPFANGDIIYKSATIGTTPTTGTPGLLVDYQFIGVKFQVLSNVVTNAIGGNFQAVPGVGNETIFGAIVALSGPTGFPDSIDLSTPDVLGETLLSPPTQTSGEVTAPLSLALPPGWYAVIFGSNLFGATGDGRAPGEYTGDTNIGSPLYFHGNGHIYVDDGNSLSTELIVTGATPEPTTFALGMFGALSLTAFGQWLRRKRR